MESGCGHGPLLLPGLGRLFSYAKMDIRVCADCGLIRTYAEPAARAKLSTSDCWKAL